MHRRGVSGHLLGMRICRKPIALSALAIALFLVGCSQASQIKLSTRSSGPVLAGDGLIDERGRENGRIVMSRWRGEKNGDDIFTVKPNGRRIRHLTRGRGDEIFPAWSPDGRLVAFVRDQDPARDPDGLWTMDRNGRAKEKVFESKAIRAFDWSPDGSRIVLSAYDSGKTELYIVDVRTKEVDPLTDTAQEDEGEPSWSPDGTRIAYSSGSGFDDQNIYSIAPSGEELRQLTEDGLSSSPEWSPDGIHIAFETGRDDENPSDDDGPFTEIYVMDATGDGETRVSNQSNTWDEDVAWAANRRVVWSDRHADGGSLPDIYTARLDGSDRRKLTATRRFSESYPAPSPDGRWIAFSRHRDGAPRRSGLFKVRIDGSRERKLLPTTSSHNSAPAFLDWGLRR